MKMSIAAAAAVTTLALCGVAQAQSTTSGDTPAGTMNSDPASSTTMPAEIVPPRMTDDTTTGTPATSNSETTSAAPSTNTYIPTREEVKAETRSMVRSGSIPHGEQSTAHQNRGAQIGSPPF